MKNFTLFKILIKALLKSTIMEFITENQLEPSLDLINQYKNSFINSELAIPDYITLNSNIEMTKDTYDTMINSLSNKDEFIYCFDNKNAEIIQKIGKTTDDNKSLCIGQWDGDRQVGVGLIIYSNGEIYQGYFKNDKKHFFGRTIFANSSSYLGQYKYGKKEGKGTYKEGGKGVTAVWKNGEPVEGTEHYEDF